MAERGEGFRQLVRNPLMGLILLACIAGGTAVLFWIKPVMGWICVGLFTAALLVRLVRWIAARRKSD